MFNLLNIKNLGDLQAIIKLLGPDVVKSIIPMLVPQLMSRIPAEIQFTDKKLAEAKLVEVLNDVIDLVILVK